MSSKYFGFGTPLHHQLSTTSSALEAQADACEFYMGNN